jgi:hypothetical protein
MCDSLFSGIYLEAAGKLQEICEIPYEDVEDQGTSRTSDTEECNPVIAFVGGRGSGKTSAMLSFVTTISQNKCDFLKTKFAGIQDYEFISLPLIDPTGLSMNESLLGVIAAHMYRLVEEFQTRYVCRTGESIDTEIATFYRELRKLYDALRLLLKERMILSDDFGGIERLGELSVSYNLRAQFKNTVNAFLQLMARRTGRKPASRSRLIIAIDDLDMNAERGYSLCEDIRRYLTIPSLVVVFSVKMDQLQDSLQQTFYRSFKDTNGSSVLSDTLRGMAEKYLAKLFPISRRLVLPTFALGNMAEYYLETSYGKKPLVQNLMELLYQKLGLILVKNDYNSHNLLPKSLRGIIHLYKLLDSMQNVFDPTKPAPLRFDGEGIIVSNLPYLSENINIFWDRYLSGYLEDSNSEDTSKENISFLRQLRTEPWPRLNRLVARRIRQIMQTEGVLPDASLDDGKSIEDICSPQTLAANVSMGDVLYMLGRLEAWSDKPSLGQLATNIRTIYSLSLIRMFFIDHAPYNMRRLIVQINNPDIQEMVPPTTDRFRRDWRGPIDMNSIYQGTIDNNQDSTIYLKSYINRYKANEAVALDKSPLGWVLLSYVWFGNPKEISRNSMKWRWPFWKESYLDTLSILSNPNTSYITISYSAFLVNCLELSSFHYAILGLPYTPSPKGEYKMFLPLYSAEIIDRIVQDSRKLSVAQKASREGKSFWSLFDEFTYGLERTIKSLIGDSDRSDNDTEDHVVAVILPFDRKAAIPGFLDSVFAVELIKSGDDLSRLQKIRIEIEKKGKRFGSIKTYCIELLDLISKIDNARPEWRLEVNRFLDENTMKDDKQAPVPGSKEPLIALIDDIIKANTERTDG